MTDRARLERLLGVQEIDVRLVALEEKQEEIPRRRAEIAHEIDALEAERTQREDALEKTRLDRRGRETELEARQTKLERYESQLGEVKTNVAYSALLTEIQGAKREVKELEDEILDLMESREDHDRRLAEIANELEERRAEARDALDALAAEEAEVERAIEVERVRRAEAVAGIDKQLYRLYDRLRRGKRFPALVPLKGQACGACFGRMTPQVVREITHEGVLHPCEACGVLVYAEPEPVEAGSAAGQGAAE